MVKSGKEDINYKDGSKNKPTSFIVTVKVTQQVKNVGWTTREKTEESQLDDVLACTGY